MRKFGKQITSAVIASAVVLGTLVFNPGNDFSGKPSHIVRAAETENAKVLDAASAVNYSTILGRAVDFGIVADKFLQKNHMETTYAINEFANLEGSNNDIDFITGTAQILVGGVNTTKTVEGKKVKDVPLIFGVTTATTFNIEGSPSAMTGFNGSSTSGYFEFNDQFVSSASHPKIVSSTNTDTSKNIKSIYNNAFEASDTINDKATDSAYSIDYNDYATPHGEDHIVIDLTKGDFANKVVYIDVDRTLLKYIGHSEGLRIIKDSSTVVALNISESAGGNRANGKVELMKMSVSVDGGNKWIKSDTGSGGGEKEHPDIDGSNSEVDAEICQKIIWNVTTSKPVDLNIVAGTFLIPNSSLVDVTGSSAGWVVARNMQNTSGEWHYIYKGGSQEVLKDENGQIHFAARKSFTHAYAGTSTLEDETVYSPAGAYTFLWYKDNSGFNTAIPSRPAGYTGPGDNTADYAEIPNTATNKLQFPILEFFTVQSEAEAKGMGDHYVANEETYYYTVRELHAGDTIDGVEISRGRINIELTVKNVSGKLQYFVKTTTYLDDGSIYKQNTGDDPAGIRMSGVEFSMGAFFNKTNNSLSVSKKVTGTCDAAKNATYYFFVRDEQGNYYNKNGQNCGNTVTEIEITGNDRVNIPNLPNGNYTVSENINKATQSGFTLIPPADKSVAVDNQTVASASFVNDYKTAFSLTIDKAVKGYGDDNTLIPDGYADRDYYVYIGSVDFPGYYLKADGTLTNVQSEAKITVKGGDSTVINPQISGRFTITEEDVDLSSLPGVVMSVDYSKKNLDVTADTQTTVTNTFKDSGYYYIHIDKTFAGADNQNHGCEFYLWYHDDTLDSDVYIDSSGNKQMEGTTPKTKAQADRISVNSGTPVDIKIPDGAGVYHIEEFNHPEIYGCVFVSDNCSSQSVTLSDSNRQGSFDITNTYAAYAITLDKQVNNDAIKGRTYAFTVQDITAGDSNYERYIKEDGTYEYGSADPYIIMVKAGTPLSIKGSAIQKDHKYKISEVETPGSEIRVKGVTYRLESITGSGQEIEISDTAYNPSATITNTYGAVGKLEVKKAVSGTGYAVCPAFPVTITLTLPDGKDYTCVTVDNGTLDEATNKVTANLKDDETVTVSGLPAGTKYSVSEGDLSDAQYDGFTSKGCTYSDSTKTIAANDVDKVTVNNTYTTTVTKGYITLTKTITGLNGENVDGMTFKVIDENNTIVATKTLNDFSYSGGVYILSHPIEVPDATKTYTVEESSNTVPGYEAPTVKYTVGSDSGTAATVTDVTASADSSNPTTVAFTNAYKKQTTVTKGYITLTKTITGLNGENVDGMTFKVIDENNNIVATKTLADFTLTNGVYTLNAAIEVPDATKTYTVEESSNTVPGYEAPTVKYTVGSDSGTAATVTDVTASADPSNPTTVAFTNAYKKQTTVTKGYITLTKTITGLNGENVDGMTFKVMDGTTVIATKTLADFTLTNGVYTLNAAIEVPDATKTYTVEESSNTVPGYEAPTVKYTVGSDSGTAATVTDVTASADPSNPTTVAFTNEYKKQTAPTGSIEISKSITLPANTSLSEIGNIEFEILDENRNVIKKITLDPDNPSADNWTEKNGKFVYTHSGLEQGKKYTVKETADGSNNTYEVEVTPQGGEREATITTGTTGASVTVEFANSYTKKQTTYKGSIEISKSITLPANTSLSDIGNIEFEILDENKNVIKKITLDPDNPSADNWTEKNGKFVYTHSGLEQGKTYTVKETADGSNNTYEVEVTPQGGEREVTIRKSTTENTLEQTDFSNSYTKKQTTYKGSIEISKSITLPANTSLSEIGNIEFEILDENRNVIKKITLDPDNPGADNWTEKNGKFVFTLSGLEQGKTYTVKETADGSNDTYKVDVLPKEKEREVTIRKSTTENTLEQTDFSNSYTKKQTTTYTGSIVITKSIALPKGADLSKIDDIKFEILDENKNVIKKITLDPDNPGADNWTENDGKFVFTLSGLEQGKEYTVKETADGSNASYKVAVTPESGEKTVNILTNPSENTSVSVLFGNYYTDDKTVNVPTGSITVTKEEAGEDPAGKPSSYSFYVKCGDKYVKADRTLGSKDDAEKFAVKAGTAGTEVSGLVLGKTYTIEEAGFDVPNGYICSTTYTASSNVALDASHDKAAVKIINTYITTGKPSAGSITVTKKVTGSVASTGMPKEYKFSIKCGEKYVQSDGSLGDDKYLFTVGPDKSVTIDNLDTDNKSYKVVEEDVSGIPNGYKLSKAAYSPDNATVDFKDPNDSGTVVITNNYTHSGGTPTPVTGKLRISKALNSGAPSEANSKTYKFKVQGNGITTIVSVKGAKSVTIDDLMPGEYSVTELRKDIEIGSYTLKVSGEKLAEIKAGETTKVKITNTYKTSTDTGKLKVKKIAKDQNDKDVSHIFHFTVQDADGKYLQSDNTFIEDEPYEFAVENGKTMTFEDLAEGVYTVKELTDSGNVDVNNYEFILGSSKVSGTGTVTAKETSKSTVTLTNVYKNKSVQPDTGSLKVKKIAKDQNDKNVSHVFHFTVQDADGKYLQSDKCTFIDNQPFKFDVDAGSTVSFDDLPLGAYTVKELTDQGSVDVNDYEFILGSSVVSGTGTVTVKETSKSTVVLTNVYKNKSVQPDTGVLKVTKTAKDQNNKNISHIFYFTVQDADGKYLQSDKSTFTKGQPHEFAVDAGTTFVFNNLPVGSYTVTEDTGSSKVKVDKYTFVLASSTVKGTGKVTVKETKNSTVTLKNVYKETSTVPDIGDLSFTKAFSGDVNEKEAIAATNMYFVIERTDTSNAAKYLKTDGTFTSNEKDAQIRLKDLDHTSGTLVWSIEINDIPVGKYKVTEYNTDVKIEGSNVSFVFDQSSSVTEDNASVSKTTSGALNLTNKYLFKGYDVKISKQDVAKKEIPKATLTLTSKDGFDLSGAVVKQGSTKISVKVSADKKSISFVTGTTPSTISGLKPGTYELKETVTPKAYLTADAITFKILRNGSVQDGKGTIVAQGSPIVMIDKADPNYKHSTPSGKKTKKVPATGEGTSPAPVIGMLLLAIGAACCTAIVIYRTKKRKL